MKKSAAGLALVLSTGLGATTAALLHPEAVVEVRVDARRPVHVDWSVLRRMFPQLDEDDALLRCSYRNERTCKAGDALFEPDAAQAEGLRSLVGEAATQTDDIDTVYEVKCVRRDATAACRVWGGTKIKASQLEPGQKILSIGGE